MTATTGIHSTLARSPFERHAFTYYDSKRADAINLDLGHSDGFYHHHFAVGDFDRSILDLTGQARQQAIDAELHRMETRQVEVIIEALAPVPGQARILDAGSGRGGTAFLLHRAFGCDIDGVNFSTYQNDFARAQARKHGCTNQVRFHDRNMVDTGFDNESFDYIVTNETTMYVENLAEVFGEFRRLLKPGGRYVLTTWCRNDVLALHSPEVAAIDDHYHCHSHRRRTYLTELLNADIVPYQLDDLTRPATPYWELRTQSERATGIEQPYLNGYRTGTVNYIRIASRRTAS
jgi:geranyl diphosphate 2-C-methyltransferase